MKFFSRLINLSQQNRLSSSSIKQCGIDLLRNPRLNRGTAFTMRERQLLGLQGLLPPAESNIDNQLNRIMDNLINVCENDLSRFNYLMSLQDRNESLFFKTIMNNVDYCMPLIYTPTVGQACLRYGLVFRRPRGLYITIYDTKYISDILDNWPETDVRVIVVTDGERILGLGDLGAYGMGIPVGKLNLYTALGGIPPEKCLPIMLDVGTNNQKLLQDPHYIGLKKPRTTGPEYDKFIDRFMHAISEKFGPNTLIQFEDFANSNAFKFLTKYHEQFCTFNDDIQGTAGVAVGGLMSSMRILNSNLKDQTFLFAGAGEASIGIADLLIRAMLDEGIPQEEALSKIYMVDSKGLLVKSNKDKMVGHKKKFAKDIPFIENLEDIVENIRPTALIGAAAVGRVFTSSILNKMAEYNERPIVFALSNPYDKAECTAQEAYEHTDGRVIFVSGTKFQDTITLANGSKFKPSVGHNGYLYPGIGYAIANAGIQPIGRDLFLVAAKTLANFTTLDQLEQGSVYPPVASIPELSMEVALACMEYAYENKIAAYYPEPENKMEFLKKRRYSADYHDAVPFPYSWPPGVIDRV